MEGEVRRTWTWQGDIPADECVRVGHGSTLEVPDTDDDLLLDLELTGDGPTGRTPARYGTHVVRHS